MIPEAERGVSNTAPAQTEAMTNVLQIAKEHLENSIVSLFPFLVKTNAHIDIILCVFWPCFSNRTPGP